MLVHSPQEDEKCYKVKVILHPERVRRQAGFGTDLIRTFQDPGDRNCGQSLQSMDATTYQPVCTE